jgi:hypothetical protein
MDPGLLSQFFLVTQGYPTAAGPLDGRLDLGPAPGVIEKFLDAVHKLQVENVVRCEAASWFKLRQEHLEVVLVPLFIRVQKNKIEGPFEQGHFLVGVGQTGVDVGIKARRFEILDRPGVPRFVDLNRYKLAPRLAQGPGNPDA